jgi:hypothetical protein
MTNFRMKQPHYDAVVEYIWLKFGCKPSDMPRQFLEEADNVVLSEEFRHLTWIMNQPIVATLDFSEPLDWLLGEHGYTIYSIRLARRLNSD